MIKQEIHFRGRQCFLLFVLPFDVVVEHGSVVGEGGDGFDESAKRGEIIFNSGERGGGFQCHGGWNFSAIRFEGGRDQGRNAFFNTGATLYEAPNRGLFEYTKKPEDIGQFRAPTLRNIAVTAPYMHDGSLKALSEVIDHYTAGGKTDHANKSRTLRPLRLSEMDKLDLIEFLNALTDEELLHDRRWGGPF